mgnify:CR=1 FL=1
MANRLDDEQIKEIVHTVLDPENIFSIYNDDRNTRIMVQNMNTKEIGKCAKQLDDILLPLVDKPYRIWIDHKPDDSNFELDIPKEDEDDIEENKYLHNDVEPADVDLSHAEEKTIVLKNHLESEKLDEIIYNKKTSLFGSVFSRPKPDEIHVHSKIIAYESYMIISGKYEIDFYRKATHKIDVNGDVIEIVMGDGIFPIKTKSGILDKFGDKMREGIGIDKEEVELEVEEHAVQRQSGTLTLDHHGHEVKEFPYKIDSKSVENYPTRILEQNSENIKPQELAKESCIDKLRTKLCKTSPQDIRMNSEKFIIDKITTVYVPVHEARCVDPKKKIEILRVDGITKKILG